MGRRVRPPAVAEDGHVMIPVQEDEPLLSKDNKERVDEFGQFRETENEAPKSLASLNKKLFHYILI